MRVAPGIVALGTALALAGCGTSERDQVRHKVEQLATAAAHRDYATICADVLAPSLITRLADAGVACRQAMRIAFGTVIDPTISIGRIVVTGSTAQAITLSAAKGQQASLDAIDLVKTLHGWRVSSLASPLNQPASG